jgi:CheY-like chemotaxis protein
MPLTILIVDDEYMNREILQAHLESAGYQIVMANNGTRALEAAASHQPDLILMDVKMPDMSGFDVCAELRSRPDLHHIPVLLLTALDDDQARALSLQSGASGLLTKPYDFKEILAQIQRLIESPT